MAILTEALDWIPVAANILAPSDIELLLFSPESRPTEVNWGYWDPRERCFALAYGAPADANAGEVTHWARMPIGPIEIRRPTSKPQPEQLGIFL